MDLRLTDKVVVVTGAASGIGGATARLLTEEGAVAVGVDRGPVDTGLGARGTAVQADLTDPAAPAQASARTSSSPGPHAPHWNAGQPSEPQLPHEPRRPRRVDGRETRHNVLSLGEPHAPDR
ncbi:SDR family NAD(P)-dependent oxidoreductase [Streptomyces mirabilis]|uniref:SDR family NAD(P)-dependent oxidoreductase n=1 Tax=Streptomyces mirabilis TaxID=68239 RepID=UPI00167DB49C|nr:SDR family NAD(P)-dependent oxidoreductase [Streptomyces mirabilis]